VRQGRRRERKKEKEKERMMRERGEMLKTMALIHGQSSGRA
jgi:hypothetical protein